MPEINQVSATLDELLNLLIKNAGIHEGNWTLTVGWQIGPGNYGPDPQHTFPGMAVTLSGLGIQRLPDGALPTNMGAVAADAAKVNPAPERAKGKAKR